MIFQELKGYRVGLKDPLICMTRVPFSHILVDRQV